MKLRIIILSILLVGFYYNGTSQDRDLDAHEWAKKLADPSDKKNDASSTLSNLIYNMDSARVFNFLDDLSRQSSSKGPYFKARYNCILGHQITIFRSLQPAFSPVTDKPVIIQVTNLLEQAMQQAYISDDDYLVAFVSSVYGAHMSAFQNTEKAVMYMMNAADLYEKLNLFDSPTRYQILGDMLWRVKEYEKSIKYSKIAIRLLDKPVFEKLKSYKMMATNTIGLSFHRMGLFDSAILYYNKALLLATEQSSNKAFNAWVGIISANMAQIDFEQGKYNVALPVFLSDYQSSNESGYYDDAANSIQWAAKTNLALGNNQEALKQVREAFRLLLKWPKAANYQQNAYLTASQIFDATGDKDSAYFYSKKYNLLHDSIEKEIYQSSISISKLRLANEQNQFNIQNIEREKKAELQFRNTIIAMIILVGVIVILLVNRQRQRARHNAGIAKEEQIRIAGEMESAKEQMQSFTKNIVEKTNLIEKLELQLLRKDSSPENQALINELSNQTILTEEDWLQFKMVFERMIPFFFENILKQYKNISPAELRMAALTKLHLTTKQMAAILGISSNSVIKAKQRLRQRLDLQTDLDVEAYINKL